VSVDSATVDSIGRLAATDPRARARLLAILQRDPSNKILNQAAAWLRKSGGAAIGPLVRATRSTSDSTALARVAYALALFGPRTGRNREIVPALAELLGDEHRTVAVMAEWALGQVAKDTRDPRVRLYRALRFDDNVDRAQAIADVGWLGPLGTRAFRMVVPMLADTSDLVRETVGRSLVRAGPAALPVVDRALRSDAPSLRLGAMLVRADLAVPSP
jgi:hypothetical protein